MLHGLPTAIVRDLNVRIEPLYLDLESVIGIPPESLYAGMADSRIGRKACVPPVFLQDLMHRLYSFTSRFGPDYD
jgi:hypothetical protein